MTSSEAKDITGGLSNPSKMPCKGYSLPAIKSCPKGSQLTKNKLIVCSFCYATHGRYLFKNVREALEKRLKSIDNPEWTEAMIKLISGNKSRWFRWHDSGDIVNYEYLKKIMYIATQIPEKKFWLPTLETEMIERWIKEKGPIPENMTVRISSVYPFQLDPLPSYLKNCSRVFRSVIDGQDSNMYFCPSRTQGNACRNCRACWSQNVPVVSYPSH